MLTKRDIRILGKKIASLSSGRYYNQIADWFDLLDQVVQEVGCGEIHLDDCPQVFNSEGNGIIRLPYPFGLGDSDLQVYWSWYRMPSGRWEIICYLT